MQRYPEELLWFLSFVGDIVIFSRFSTEQTDCTTRVPRYVHSWYYYLFLHFFFFFWLQRSCWGVELGFSGFWEINLTIRAMMIFMQFSGYGHLIMSQDWFFWIAEKICDGFDYLYAVYLDWEIEFEFLPVAAPSLAGVGKYYKAFSMKIGRINLKW